MVLLLWLPLLSSGCVSLLDPATAREIPEEVRHAVRQSVDQGYRTGVVIGLVNREGVHTFAYPSAAHEGTGEVVSVESVFAVGSLTKVFTGIVLADMVERGEVDLEGPVNRYLPAGLEIPSRDGVELTLAHLATHTSGLPKEAPGWDWHSAEPADAIVRFARDYDYPRAYGAAYEYSNLGMAFLGRVLERRGGKPLADLLRERVAAPLGLSETGYSLSPEGAPRLATPHRGAEALPAEELAVPASAHAAGGLYSTGHDLLAFVAANLEAASGGPASGEAASGMAAGLRRSWVPRARTDEDGLAMGLGWKLYQQGERTLVHHGGQSAGHQAFIGFDPAAGYGVVLLAASRADDDLDRVALHLLSPRVPLPDFSLPPEVVLPPEVLAAHTGSYRIEGGNGVELSVEDGRMVYVETTPEGKHVRTTPLRAESDSRFTIPGLPVSVEAQRRDGRTVALALRIEDGEEFVARRVE